VRQILILATLAALAGCGVDGPPQPPQQAQPGVTISGEARTGVSARL
jgi:predicted small lipoprotein YifL